MSTSNSLDTRCIEEENFMVRCNKLGVQLRAS